MDRFTSYSATINFIIVVPHITDAIQEWVERVAIQPVTEDGDKPVVIKITLYMYTYGSFFFRFSLQK